MAEVQKSAFSLMGATIMMGRAFTDDVFSLTPSAHSVGMANEVNVGIDSSINELLNGVEQVPVDSRKTGVVANITGNVFEMTAQNFMRSQGMSGAALQIKRGILASPAAAAAVSLSITSDPIPGETASAITGIADIPSGSTILIQRVDGEQDYVFPTMSSGAATGTGPYAVPIAAPYAIPAGMSFPAGARVWVVQPVAVADIDSDDLFCLKIAGKLTNYDRPVVYIAPKVRIVRGFQLSFNETQYSSMPWEMRPLLLSKTESTGRLTEVGTRRTGRLYVGA